MVVLGLALLYIQEGHLLRLDLRSAVMHVGLHCD